MPIKSPGGKGKPDSDIIKKTPAPTIVDISKGEYPLFCFKYLSEVSIKKCKDHKVFYHFLTRLKSLSELGWKEMHTSSRHSFGMEKIPVDQIKPKLPSCVTPDVSELVVLRANGNNLPFLGIRYEHIFRVLFIETKFGDIYDHNKKGGN